MPVFYFTFQVTPTTTNAYADTVSGALALCWIDAVSADAALAIGKLNVRRHDWTIDAIKAPPIAVTEDNFRDRDIGLEHFRTAAEFGHAIYFVAVARDGKSNREPIEMSRPTDFDLGAYLTKRKRLKQKGRCLHYQAGDRCSHPIDAHSIQKNGALSLVAEKGHVYALSSNFNDIRTHRGRPAFTKQGIQKVSTFRGFCSKHDAELFHEIDNGPLIPTPRQVLLYAYRSLCRETFVKENALHLFEPRRIVGQGTALDALIANIRRGTEIAHKELLRHKAAYERSLDSGSGNEIQFVAFCSRQPPTVAFSGLLFPDYDFLGRQLQDLADLEHPRDLLTLSFAPLTTGWCALFAWHAESARTCVPFIHSLAARCSEDRSSGGDHIFRFLISSCENLAFSPRWWESLQSPARSAIQKAMADTADIFSATNPNYVAEGLEGISRWEFDSVIQ